MPWPEKFRAVFEDNSPQTEELEPRRQSARTKNENRAWPGKMKKPDKAGPPPKILVLGYLAAVILKI